MKEIGSTPSKTRDREMKCDEVLRFVCVEFKDGTQISFCFTILAIFMSILDGYFL